MLIAALTCGAAGTAQDEAEVQGRLDEVRAKIEAVRARLAAQRQSESTAQAALAAAETALGEATRQRRSIDARIDAERERLAALRRDEAEARTSLAGQRERLAEAVRASYLLGRQSRLKLWLDQEDPSTVGRNMAYFDFVQDARVEAIDTLVGALTELARIRDEIDAAIAGLERLSSDAAAAEQRAVAAREDRRTALADVRSELARDGAALVDLEARQAELETLLEELRLAFADIPDDLSGKPFDTLQGQLPWPTLGTLEGAPGQRKEGGLSRQGALIEAAEGTSVRAIAGGRVAYADWLRGFGLLSIIDHGDGYLSLYAFQESLSADVGDWVRAGEAIGTAGRTGGRDESALYFELRRGGQPIDPRPWFSEARPKQP